MSKTTITTINTDNTNTNNTINTSTSYLGHHFKTYEEILILAMKHPHLYLMNPCLSLHNHFIYIDCTSSPNLSCCEIKLLNFPYENDTEKAKFVFSQNLKASDLFEGKYIVLTAETSVRHCINLIYNEKLNPPVEFSNGSATKQNYLKNYPTTPVKYQIIITNESKLRGPNSDKGYDIVYEGRVMIEHYNYCGWKQVFRIEYDTYAKAFKACEQFIQNHMYGNPVYDNQ